MQPTSSNLSSTVNVPRNKYTPIGDIDSATSQYDDPGLARQLAEASISGVGRITPYDLDYHYKAAKSNPGGLSTQLSSMRGDSSSNQRFNNPTSGQAEEEYNRALGGRVSATDTYNSALDQLGISDARTRVQGLRTQLMNTENLLKNVEGDVSGRTQNSSVTEGQRRRLVATEQAPLNTQLDTMGDNFKVAEEDYQGILGEGTRYAEMASKEQNEYMDALLQKLKTSAEREGKVEDARRYENELLRLRKADQLDWAKFDQSKIQSDREWALANRPKAEASSGGGGGGGGRSGGGSGGSGGAAPANYQQRSGGGYNFQGANGKPVSARRFAQDSGTDFNALLRQMAASGDKGAADVLKNGGSSKYYKNLTWN